MALLRDDRLAMVHPQLVRLFTDMGKGGVDLIVIQGARTIAEEQADMASGHSALTNPMDSKHVIGPGRPLARAVDVAPYPVDWNNTQRFQALASNVKAAADAIGLQIVWGGDWQTLKDLDHYELADSVQ